jgi:hypothetical protein
LLRYVFCWIVCFLLRYVFCFVEVCVSHCRDSSRDAAFWTQTYYLLAM